MQTLEVMFAGIGNRTLYCASRNSLVKNVANYGQTSCNPPNAINMDKPPDTLDPPTAEDIRELQALSGTILLASNEDSLSVRLRHLPC